MNAPVAANQPDILVFQRPPSPLAIFFIAVPALLLLMLAITIANHKFPLPLLGLLAVLGGSCMFWISQAIGEIGTVTIEMTPEELRVKRLVGSSSYSWSFVESVKMFDPDSTMADGGRTDEGRAGIGLYLRDPNKKERAPDAPPDAVLVSGIGDLAEHIVKSIDKISNYHRRMANSDRGKPGSGVAGFNMPKKAFRRPAVVQPG